MGRGLLGAAAGLGQGMAQAGQTMGEVLKFQYLEQLRRQDKLEDREYDAQVRQESREYQESLLEEQRGHEDKKLAAANAREDAQRGVRQEIEGDKLVTYNAKGEVVESKPYQPKPERKYLDPKVKAAVEGIDNELKTLREDGAAEENSGRIAELERRRGALLNGGDARPAADISSEIVDGMLFDGSGRGLLRPGAKPAAEEKPARPGFRDLSEAERIAQVMKANPGATKEQAREFLREKGYL